MSFSGKNDAESLCHFVKIQFLDLKRAKLDQKSEIGHVRTCQDLFYYVNLSSFTESSVLLSKFIIFYKIISFTKQIYHFYKIIGFTKRIYHFYETICFIREFMSFCKIIGFTKREFIIFIKPSVVLRELMIFYKITGFTKRIYIFS